MYEKETIDYKGMTIKVYYDEYCDSPADWDNSDAFLCADYRYGLSVDSESISARECRDAIEEGKWFLNGFYIFPVSIYDHSGICIELGESHGWDYSNGYAFVCVKRMKGWSWARSKARTIAKGVVEEWNMYLTGEVYAVTAEDEDENEIFSCGGFYGDEGLKDGISEAKNWIVCEIEERTQAENKAFFDALRKHINVRKAQIRAHAPYYARTAFGY